MTTTLPAPIADPTSDDRQAPDQPARSGRWRRRRGDIARLAARRVAVAIPMLAALSAGVFVLAAHSPFNPLAAYLGAGYQHTSEASRDSMATALGLDQPWWRTWWGWLTDVAHGDLGWSRVYSMPVTSVFTHRLPWTLLLSATGLVLAVLLALAAGTAAGLRPGSLLDRACSGLAVLIQAIPPFVVALAAVAVFAVGLQWSPAGGATAPGMPYTASGVITHLILPGCALAVTMLPWLLLSVRTSVAGAVDSDAVRGARARGVPPARIVTGHIVPVSLAPLVTIIGARLTELIVGAVLVETIFGWPGLASAVVESAKALDFPLLAALTLATTATVLVGSLLADIAYLLLDPRVSSDV
ncbi:MAG: ABC transporter permease [Tomitella sp.]|nr:ABC transporter permease [Tomitella sp.]